jgi:hypothetical protein
MLTLEPTLFSINLFNLSVLPLGFDFYILSYGGHRKVAGSIPDGVAGFFYWHNPSDRTMALGSTQLLTEMSTRNIFGGKGSQCVGLTTVPPSCTDCLEFWEPQPPGTLRACQGL